MLLTLTSLVAGALAWTQKREADRERDLAVERATEIENHNLAEKIARRAWYDLLANQPQTALASVQEALQLNPDLTWARPSLAHAQLLLGHYETAKSLYLTNKDLRFELNGRETSFTEQVLGDFSKLRQRGITNSDMQKIEALLKRKQAPIPGSPPPGK
jgi:tetratricopeptide (TPR) repeat protein